MSLYEYLTLREVTLDLLAMGTDLSHDRGRTWGARWWALVTLDGWRDVPPPRDRSALPLPGAT